MSFLEIQFLFRLLLKNQSYATLFCGQLKCLLEKNSSFDLCGQTSQNFYYMI